MRLNLSLIQGTPPPMNLIHIPELQYAFSMFRHNPTDLISLTMFWDQSVNEYGMNVLSSRMYVGILLVSLSVNNKFQASPNATVM